MGFASWCEADWASKPRSRCLKINRFIKSAASAASQMTKMQGSPWTAARHADNWKARAPLHLGHWGGFASSQLDHPVDLRASQTKFSSLNQWEQLLQALPASGSPRNMYICFSSQHRGPPQDRAGCSGGWCRPRQADSLVFFRKSEEKHHEAFFATVCGVSAAPRCSQVQQCVVKCSPCGVQHGSCERGGFR